MTRRKPRSQTHCPRCHSIQSFPIRYDYYEENRVKVYLRCGKCKWETTIFDGSRTVYRLQNEVQTLQAAAQRGAPTKRKLEKRRAKLREELIKDGSDQRK